ncbi:hypothetical protein ILUMI_14277 [Ignelater luminosus]|uniref:Serpin domain-containing protein n=1 Tax=Ignelater luminosus TaxID=2038154 RepID=A0A8K0CV64_IGNLU|nr:hypothetical protein ILUMI_14277 [Ignelater luminosus]
MDKSDFEEISEASNRFANKLYRIISKQKGNILFSPTSVHIVLSLLYQGANSETAEAIECVLGVPNKEAAANGYNNIMKWLNQLEDVTLHSANKIYVMKNFSLKEEFHKSAVEQFLSEVEEINFKNNTETAKKMNRWVENKTNSKIKDLVSPSSLDGLTRLVLINAIYFKGNWLDPFIDDSTTTESFFRTSNDKIDCQMMHTNAKFNYCENEYLDAKILEMKYRNINVSMVCVLPNEIDGIENLEKKLIDVDLSTLTNDSEHVKVKVSLPKFRFDKTIELEDVLKEVSSLFVSKAFSLSRP